MLSPYDLYLQLGDNDMARQRSYRALFDAQLESRELESLRGLLAEGEASGFADYSYEKMIQQLDSEMH